MESHQLNSIETVEKYLSDNGITFNVSQTFLICSFMITLNIDCSSWTNNDKCCNERNSQIWRRMGENSFGEIIIFVW